MNTIAFLNCHGDDVFCFRKEIIEALVDRGCRVVLSCPEHPRLDYFRNKEGIIIEDIQIDRRGTNPLKDIKLIWDYIRLFKKYRPSYICAFTIKPNIYGSVAADLVGIPHINNITGIGSGYKNGGLVKKIVISLYKIALRKSQMVFFQNKENLQTALATKMISQKTRYQVIPGSGVNFERFAYKEKEESDKVTFNYIGRVMKDKRIDDYLKAAIVIKEKYPQIVFNILGFIEKDENCYEKELKSLEEKGIVHYCGNVDDVRPYIYSSDAIIHPSTYGEGISNVLLETAACGRACITTNIEGCHDCVDDGVSGYIYESGNIDQLINRIEVFISLNPGQRKQMGMAGRKKVEKEFDRKLVVDSYLKELGL